MNTDQESAKLSYNRVLLKCPAFSYTRRLSSQRLKDHTTSDTELVVTDTHTLTYVMEQLISFGVLDVAVPWTSFWYDQIDVLPPALKQRVVRVDDRPSIVRLRAVLAPIIEEFRVVFSDGELAFRKAPSRKRDKTIAKAIYILYWSLYEFLLGFQHELQIDINLEWMKAAAGFLRQISRNPDSRSVLAILEGVLNTYRPRRITPVELRSCAPRRHVSLFQDFVQDVTYRRMSACAHSFGFPDRVRRATGNFNRWANKLLTAPQFKTTVKVGSQLVSLVPYVPEQLVEKLVPVFVSLVKKKYYPPIIPPNNAVEQARKAWRLAVVGGDREEDDMDTVLLSTDWRDHSYLIDKSKGKIYDSPFNRPRILRWFCFPSSGKQTS